MSPKPPPPTPFLKLQKQQFNLNNDPFYLTLWNFQLYLASEQLQGCGTAQEGREKCTWYHEGSTAGKQGQNVKSSSKLAILLSFFLQTGVQFKQTETHVLRPLKMETDLLYM